LLSFRAEFFVFQFAIQKYKDYLRYTEIYVILPVVLYGRETWSLTLKEERRLRVFENGVLRIIIRPKRDKVIGNGENYIMSGLKICTHKYCSGDKIDG
jgi:hypothetical protein